MYITNHYLYFIIAAGVLIISAIGFVVDEKKQSLSDAKEARVEDKDDKKDKKEKTHKK